MKLPLTERQKEVLEFITEFIQGNDYPPTIKEIQEGVGVSNPGSIYGTLSELENKEYIIRKRKHKARNIGVTQNGKEYFQKDE